MKRQPIPVTIEKDNEVHRFESMAEAGRFLGCQTASIGIQKTYKGWKITLHENRHKMHELKRKCYLFNKHGEFLEEFESVHDLARHLNISPRDINRCLNNGKYKDYILSYSKQNENTYNLNDFV